MRRRVLITGASGFIGKRLAGALAKEGWQVRAAAREPASIPAIAGVERVAMPDLSQPADWSGLLDGITHVVLLAGIAHATGSLSDEIYSRINAEAVGEFAGQVRAKVERLVFMSSVRAQVGVSVKHVITERDLPLPTDAYGRAKLRAERLLAQSGIPFAVLRPAVVYGKGVKGNIAALATLAKTPMPLPFARLTNRRSLLALDNLVAAISLVLTAKEAEGGTYLVADRDPISVADMIAAMREGLGRAPHLVNVPAGAIMRLMKSFGREAEWERISTSFVIDAAKLRGIGWTPTVETREGLARMMRSENGAAG
ncbi:MAG TPA: NAD-dependent epimerase/dehydratase family protein [Methyloceanibacter sp.]|jgi:UDP-glucose 4-epimerase|nr:NAD-dependent epimerase/dehydratase family protein [Methyloceanibacter sp.]